MSQIQSFNLLLALSNMGGLTHNTRFVCILIFGGDFALPWPMNLVIAFNSLPDFYASSWVIPKLYPIHLSN
jgi:hypothetical protein